MYTSESGFRSPQKRSVITLPSAQLPNQISTDEPVDHCRVTLYRTLPSSQSLGCGGAGGGAISAKQVTSRSEFCVPVPSTRKAPSRLLGTGPSSIVSEKGVLSYTLAPVTRPKSRCSIANCGPGRWKSIWMSWKGRHGCTMNW